MTVSGLKEALNLTAFALPQGERDVRGGYAGDLLSWVMGRAQADDAWLTIMSNPNIVAVATLTDVSCIILCEGVAPDASHAPRAARGARDGAQVYSNRTRRVSTQLSS